MIKTLIYCLAFLSFPVFGQSHNLSYDERCPEIRDSQWCSSVPEEHKIKCDESDFHVDLLALGADCAQGVVEIAIETVESFWNTLIFLWENLSLEGLHALWQSLTWENLTAILQGLWDSAIEVATEVVRAKDCYSYQSQFEVLCPIIVTAAAAIVTPLAGARIAAAVMATPLAGTRIAVGAGVTTRVRSFTRGDSRIQNYPQQRTHDLQDERRIHTLRSLNIQAVIDLLNDITDDLSLIRPINFTPYRLEYFRTEVIPTNLRRLTDYEIAGIERFYRIRPATPSDPPPTILDKVLLSSPKQQITTNFLTRRARSISWPSEYISSNIGAEQARFLVHFRDGSQKPIHTFLVDQPSPVRFTYRIQHALEALPVAILRHLDVIIIKASSENGLFGRFFPRSLSTGNHKGIQFTPALFQGHPLFVQSIIDHEVGHLIQDTVEQFVGREFFFRRWENAMSQDGATIDRDGNVTGNIVSDYGSSSLVEDFAESVALYLGHQKGLVQDQAISRFPNRIREIEYFLNHMLSW